MRINRILVPMAALPVVTVVTAGLVGPAAAGGSALAGSKTAATQQVCAGAASMSTAGVNVPGAPGESVVRDIRVGQQSGCDRVVFEFDGPTPGYRVQYVSKVTQDGSGATVPLEGKAFLEVVIQPTTTRAHADQTAITPRFTVLRQVKGAGDFEAVTSYGIGLASKQPFLAYRLTAPNRLVIDIAAPARVAGPSAGSGSTGSTGSTGSAQVLRIPSGGVATGSGSTTGLQDRTLLAVGGGLLVAAGVVLMARRRVAREF